MSLRIALPKGALFEESLSLLERGGFEVEMMRSDSRKLRFTDEAAGVEYIVARPTDIPTYVEYGGVDLGIAGKDVLMESRAQVFELLDLGYGGCRIVVAAPEGRQAEVRESYLHLGQMRVATKYPNVTEDFFSQKGIQVEIVKLHGSIELAPLVGLAEEIVDIASTGRTLAENNLVVIEEIAACTARLVSNQVSQRLRYDRIGEFVERIESGLGVG
ncbi:MAG: ATP phosphoribosyltransferase [Actinobacteria bacterium]|nr:MAG: ATP phosphoribosyltransferase [Actinomycetota bacterium]